MQWQGEAEATVVEVLAGQGQDPVQDRGVILLQDADIQAEEDTVQVTEDTVDTDGMDMVGIDGTDIAGMVIEGLT